MFKWLFNVYIDAVMKEVKMIGRMGVKFLEEGRAEIAWSLAYRYFAFCG